MILGQIIRVIIPASLMNSIDLKITGLLAKQIARVMTNKLTLTIEKKVIESAKKYASQRGKSLSHLVENYLKSISSKETSDDELSPKVKKLMGVIKLPDDFNYKTELGNALSKKHLK